MLLESFSMAILKWLRIPPGSSIRKTSNPNTSSASVIQDNDYIQAILDITVDDICIGDLPLSISYEPSTPNATALHLDQICDEFNTIIKDAAKDLLKGGYSVYDISIDKKTNKLLAIPYIKQVEFYLTPKKEIVCYDVESKDQLKERLIFLNFTKESLVEVEKIDPKIKSDVLFKIEPEPMQLKNAEKTISGLTNAENSIARYRALLRPVRFANVDIGTAQGDVQKQSTDSIASAINSNSASLGNSDAFTDFDDNIPVLPNRRGLGKVDIYSDIPSADIKEMADMDYWISKLNLVMRFPGTYMDFSKALSESAVSMIRGDLRYTKLCKAVQSKLLTPLNNLLISSKFKKYKPLLSLTSLPSSEDDDVMNALDNYCDLAEKAETFVIGDAEDSKELRLHRLKLLQDLFSTSTNSPMLQKWFDDFLDYINKMKEEGGDEEDSESGEGDFESFEGSDFEDSSSDGEFEEFEDDDTEVDEGGIDLDNSEDVELLETQS